MTAPAPASAAPSALGLGIRAGLFLLFVRVFGMVFGSLLLALLDSLLVASAVGLFAAASLATWLVVRVFERGRLEDVGLDWHPAARRHLISGVLGGALAGVAAVGFPVLLGMAAVERAPEPELAFGAGKFVLVTLMLWMGAAGEELMFRGYALQILARRFGPWWVIPPFAVLFALAHFANPDASLAGVGNTALWGLVLGLAWWRSRDLWLPIGLHFGWNWVLSPAGELFHSTSKRSSPVMFSLDAGAASMLKKKLNVSWVVLLVESGLNTSFCWCVNIVP